MRDATCSVCEEFTSTIYPVDGLENVKTLDCIKRSVAIELVLSDRRGLVGDCSVPRGLAPASQK